MSFLLIENSFTSLKLIKIKNKNLKSFKYLSNILEMIKFKFVLKITLISNKKYILYKKRNLIIEN